MATARARAEARLAPIEQHAGAPPHVAAGLEFLTGLPPLWLAGPELWRLQLAHVKDFAAKWDHRARLVGWCDLTLYGVHRSAPAANFAALGGAWVAARSAYTVLAIEDQGAILVATQTASRLRIYRQAADPDAVLPWQA
jgi:hypothetical protein